MKKYKFLRISKYKKLRYIANNYKKNLYIVFLPGFASDIDGDKPKKFLKFAIQNKLGFLALEYFGHGRSSGEFTRGNISKWSNDARITIKKIVKNKLKAGESERDIKKFLVERYGEYILFRPLMNYNNIFLWSFPFILVIIGLFFVLIKSKAKKV